jgi:hypothetical protein
MAELARQLMHVQWLQVHPQGQSQLQVQQR